MASTTRETRSHLCQVLAELLQKQPSLRSESRRLAALLRDYSPHSRREILALKLAQEEGLINELERLEGQLPMPALLARLTHQLREASGLTESLARWSVVSWASALGYLTADSDEVLAAETLSESDTAPAPNDERVATEDPYAEVLRAAQESLTSAQQTALRSDALRLAERALQLGAEAVQRAPRHARLLALVIQARAEVARFCSELAEEASNDGQAASYWQRVLEVAPTDRHAASRLQKLNDHRTQRGQQAEELWNRNKFRTAIKRWEELQRRWPQDADLGRICGERRKALVEIEQLVQEAPRLEQTRQVQQLTNLYDRLATLAPALPGLDEARARLACQLVKAEPALEKARQAMDRARYADALLYAQTVLKTFTDHAAATDLVECARRKQQEYEARSLAWRKALADGRFWRAGRIEAEFTPAEFQLPELAKLRAKYEAQRQHQRVKQWRVVGAMLGLIAWLGAWWLADKTASNWPDLSRFVPGRLAREEKFMLMRGALFVTLASFLLGIVAAVLRGRAGFATVTILLGATGVQIPCRWLLSVLPLSFPWLVATPILRTTWQQLLVIGTYGLWLGIAVRCLTGIRDNSWILSGLTVALAGTLWYFLGKDHNLGVGMDSAQVVLLAVLLWIVGGFLTDSFKSLRQTALVPFGAGLAMLVPANVAGEWSSLAWPLVTGTFFAISLLTLTALSLTRPQIGGIWFGACLATYVAQYFGPPYGWFAMLWCCAWLPVALQRSKVATDSPMPRTPPPLPAMKGT